jgi:glyoxylase-like metal-dependent hydrolase (beta-lactamase superfamily II)
MEKVRHLSLGSIDLYSLTDGTFRLDGGAMFGVVPRVIWEKTNPPDELNRIAMGLNPLLVVSGGKRVLVDTGIGEKLGKKATEIYAVDRSYNLIDSLRELDLSPEDIDVVVNTHLHFDHCGGNTKIDEDGNLVPTFPEARYYVAKGEWEDAVSPGLRTQRSYDPDDFVPIADANQLTLVEGRVGIAPGVYTYPTPGHNEHHQSVYFESGEEGGIYLGDLIPTTSHVPLPYVMGYDLLPATTVEVKKTLLDEAFSRNWLLVFEHDPEIRWGRLEKRGEGYLVQPVDGRTVR